MFMNCNFSTNLFKQEAVGSSPTARSCDGCRAVQSMVYCHSDAECLHAINRFILLIKWHHVMSACMYVRYA
jgi:hypothetical protein